MSRRGGIDENHQHWGEGIYILVKQSHARFPLAETGLKRQNITERLDLYSVAVSVIKSPLNDFHNPHAKNTRSIKKHTLRDYKSRSCCQVSLSL